VDRRGDSNLVTVAATITGGSIKPSTTSQPAATRCSYGDGSWVEEEEEEEEKHARPDPTVQDPIHLAP
jgi:hypothetical protein